MASFQFGDPRPMQAAGRLNRDHGVTWTVFIQCQLKLCDAFSRDR
jgi:hypothetical protein